MNIFSKIKDQFQEVFGGGPNPIEFGKSIIEGFRGREPEFTEDRAQEFQSQNIGQQLFSPEFAQEAASNTRNLFTGIRDFGVDVLRAFPREGAGAVIEGSARLQGLDPKEQELKRAPEGSVVRKAQDIVFGEEPVRSLSAQGEEVLESFGAGEDVTEKFGLPLGLTFLGLDLLPGGQGKKKIIDELANTRNVSKVQDILRSIGIGDEVSQEAATTIAKTRNTDEIGNIVNNLADIQGVERVVPTTPIPRTIQQFDDLPFEQQDEVFEFLSKDIQDEIFSSVRFADDVGRSPAADIADKIVRGEMKVRVPKGIKTEAVEALGKGTYARVFRNDPTLSTLDELANDVGVSSSELLESIQGAIQRRTVTKQQALETRKATQASIKAERVNRKRTTKELKGVISQVKEEKKLNSTVVSRLKGKYGIKEMKNATPDQLKKVYAEMQDLLPADEFLPMGQVRALQKFGINSTTTKREATRILGDVANWKKRTFTFFNFFKTIDDKIDSIAGKDADKVKEVLTRPRAEAVTKMFEEEIQLKREMREMLNKLGVNDKKARALIMRYGEGRISLDSLKEADSRWSDIVQADKWFRSKYDSLLEETNNVLRKFYPEDKLIPKRQDYYTHFHEMNALWQTVTGKGGDINPVLEGISEFTKPNRRFNPFALQRKGGMSFVEDAGRAFEAYLNPILHNKHLSETIVRHKAVADILAHNTIETRNVNLFIRSLREHANNLANKTNSFDRSLMNNVFGRNALNLINASSRRFGANRIVGNVGSAIMQISGLPTSVLENNIIRTSRGLFVQAVSPLNRAKDPILESRFLIRRYGEKGLRPGETVFPSKIQQGGRILSIPFEFIEQNITKAIWRASFDNAFAQGFRGEKLIQEADEIAERIVGGRAPGEKALAFESGILSLPLQFQLEVNAHAMSWKRNVFDKMFSDPVKATRASIETAATLFLFNTLFEKTMGRTPLPDPIRAATDAAETDTWPEKIGRIAGEGLSSAPGGQFVANLVPQDVKQRIFGRSEVGIYPGGIPLASALSGGFRDPGRFVYDFVLPYGGGQLKKIVEGADALAKGGSYNRSGKLQFPINQSEWLRVVLLGKYSTPTAKEYFDKQRTVLTEKQTVEYFLRTRKGEKPSDVYNDVTKERRQNEYKREIQREIVQQIKNKPNEGLALFELWKKQGIIDSEMEKEIIEALTE